MGEGTGTHGNAQPNDGIHTSWAWTFATDADRLSFSPASGHPLSAAQLTANDHGRIGFITGTNEAYWLTDYTATGAARWTAVGNDALDPDQNKVLVKALKASAGTIAKGTVVGIVVAVTGQAHTVTVEAADYTDANTLPVIGMANETITDSQVGEVMVVGSVEGLNTSGLTLKLPLYLSTSGAGNYTQTQPSGPYIPFPIGAPMKIDASDGVISVSALSSTPVSNETPAAVAATGSPGTSGDISRRDHVHALPTNIPAGTIDFSVGAAPAHTEGRVFYDNAAKALAVYNDESAVTLQVGQEIWLRVYNATGQAIANGASVYINGADSGSGLPTVALARADAQSTAEAVGLATQVINDASVGHVTVKGVVNDLDTSAFAAGDRVFVSPTTAGALVNTPPAAPNASVRIGYVLRSNVSAGKIFVNNSGIPGLPRVLQVSSNDTTANYLESKLTQGDGVVLSVQNEGANENILVAANLTATAPANVTKAAASAGVSTEVARRDHKHDIATAAATNLLIGSVNSEGTSTSLARADHTHQISAGGTTNACSAAAGSAGSSAVFTRSDHTHTITVGSPVTIVDSSNADGTSDSLARADHVHAHGNRGGGSLHSVATTSVAGFLSAADKTLVDTIPAGGLTPFLTTTEVTATADATTTGTSYATMTSMTATPASGTYEVVFSASGSSSIASANCDYAIFVDGTIVAHSERQMFYGGGSQAADVDMTMHTRAKVSVNGSQAIDIRWRTDQGTFTAHERSLAYRRTL